MTNFNELMMSSQIAAGAKLTISDKGTTLKRIMVLAVTTALMNGCAGTMSGLDESGSSFSCKAPEGVTCTSVTGIYANAAQNNLPALEKAKNLSTKVPSDKAANKKTPDYFEVNNQSTNIDPGKPTEPNKISPAAMKSLQSGDPIRSQPLTLRIWMAPWIDADGDLHDQRYVYTTVHNGEWLIEANRAAIKDKYKPVSISKRALETSSKAQSNDKGSSIAEALANPQGNDDGSLK